MLMPARYRNIVNTSARIYRLLRTMGFDPRATYNFLRYLGPYIRELRELNAQAEGSSLFPVKSLYPVFSDRLEQAGVMSGHYFHQDLYVAKRIFANKPQQHLDIGSRIDGFVAHVATFMPVDVCDIRDQESQVENINFRRCDLMELPTDLIESYESVSSLHAIEHFGLGRYGDKVCYYGYLKALENISKILIPGGRFYFAVPIGPQRIEFNAHRVFSVSYLLETLRNWYQVHNFSYVDDKGDFHPNVVLADDVVSSNFGCHYGCGIFELVKR